MDARSRAVGAGLAGLVVAADGRPLRSIVPLLDSPENRWRTAHTVLGPCGRSSRRAALRNREAEQ